VITCHRLLTALRRLLKMDEFWGSR
jgi:hypothetical protein